MTRGLHSETERQLHSLRLKTKTGNYSQVVDSQEHDPHMVATEANAVLDHLMFTNSLVIK